MIQHVCNDTKISVTTYFKNVWHLLLIFLNTQGALSRFVAHRIKTQAALLSNKLLQIHTKYMFTYSVILN
jgi:hypothetical protein